MRCKKRFLKISVEPLNLSFSYFINKFHHSRVRKPRYVAFVFELEKYDALYRLHTETPILGRELLGRSYDKGMGKHFPWNSFCSLPNNLSCPSLFPCCLLLLTIRDLRNLPHVCQLFPDTILKKWYKDIQYL